MKPVDSGSWPVSFFRLTALLVCLHLFSGCEKVFTDKHSAEENGYLTHFKAAFDATCRIGSTQLKQTGISAVQMPCGAGPQGPSGTCTQYVPIFESVPINWLSDVGVNALDVSAVLERTLPPSGLGEAQKSLARTLRLEMQHDAALGAQAKATCKTYSEFERAVQARTEALATTDSLYISYETPIPGLPGVEIDTRSGVGFTLDQSVTIPTKVGSFTAGYKGPPGIHMLRVVSEGKQRYLTLDRPFEFYVPKGYSTSVIYQGADELILVVNKN